MESKKGLKFNPENLVFSCLTGYNYYYYDEKEQAYIFGLQRYIVTHNQTQKKYFLSLIPNECLRFLNEEETKKSIEKYIMHPPAKGKYLWPVDFVRLPEGFKFIYSRFYGVDEKEKGSSYAFVYDYVPENPTKSLSEFISSSFSKNSFECSEEFSWRSNRELIMQMLEYLQRIEEDGYCCFTLSDKYIYYKVYDGKPAGVEIELGIYTDCINQNYNASMKVLNDYVDYEYADPYYMKELRAYSGRTPLDLDMRSAYYSLAVILFRLCTGRFPYEGIHMVGQNATPQEHKLWFDEYHNDGKQRFIFCCEDYSIEGSDLSDGLTMEYMDSVCRNHWMQLSDELREMFIKVLKYSSVLRKEDSDNSKPNIIRSSEWLAAFKRQYASCADNQNNGVSANMGECIDE